MTNTTKQSPLNECGLGKMHKHKFLFTVENLKNMITIGQWWQFDVRNMQYQNPKPKFLQLKSQTSGFFLSLPICITASVKSPDTETQQMTRVSTAYSYA